MTRIWRVVLVACVVLAPAAAGAQADHYAQVSFATSQHYDNNLFASAASGDRQPDVIFRFGPVVEAGYVSVPLRLVARYGFEGERYLEHVALNKNFARQDAAVEVYPFTTRRLTFGAKASYVETHTPNEFNLETGLAAGRARAERLGTGVGATYEWSSVTRLAVGYGFGKDALAGGVASAAHDARIGVENHSDPRSSRRFDYRFRYFSFGDRATEASHMITAGWSRELTRRTGIELALGPRISDRGIRPELSASIRRRLQNGSLSTSYSRTQTTAIGEQGVIEVQRIAVAAGWQAARRLTLSASPAYITVGRAGARVSIYALDVEATSRSKHGLSVVALGRIGLQAGTLAGRREEIPYRSVSLRLVATFPHTPRGGHGRLPS